MAGQVTKEKQSSLDNFLEQTPSTPSTLNKKTNAPSSSPDITSLSMYQTDKASCIYTTSSDTLTPNLDCEAEVPTDYVEKDTIFKLSEVVCATLKNQKFIDAIIPSITDKVMDMIRPQIELIIEERIEPHAQAIRHQEHILSLKEKQIDEQNAEIKALKTKLDKVEARLEEHEQYSRRTSLRIHNVSVLTD